MTEDRNSGWLSGERERALEEAARVAEEMVAQPKLDCAPAYRPMFAALQDEQASTAQRIADRIRALASRAASSREGGEDG